MTVNLSYFAGAGWQFFDDNGNPLSGGKLYTYLAGTTTPAVTYTTISGIATNPNPIILDAAGRPTEEVWLTSGVNYKFVVKNSADVTSRTYDNLNGINDFSQFSNTFANTTDPALGDALVGFRQSNASGNLNNAVGRTVHQKLQESVSVKDFGAVADGVTDDSAAFNAAWAYVKSQYESLSTYSPINYASLIVPPGKYAISNSINWTALTAWNLSVFGYGAVLIGTCANKPVIDMTAVMGISVHGITVYGDATLTPSCAILVGPSSTITCGVNKFYTVQAEGYYAIASVGNIGSETTSWYSCEFVNNKTGADLYTYVGDALNTLGFTSNYTTLRASGVWASLTNNSFYSCHFRNYANGSSTFVQSVTGWSFDEGCYFLAFDSSNLVVAQTQARRISNLSIAGIFETSQGSGLKYGVTFVVPNGEFCNISGFSFTAGVVPAATAIFRLVNEAGTNLTAGLFKLNRANIRIDSRWAGSANSLFQGTLFYLSGNLTADSEHMNLGVLVQFTGVIQTNNIDDAISLPVAGEYQIFSDANNLLRQTTIRPFTTGSVGLMQPISSTTLNVDMAIRGAGNGAISLGNANNTNVVSINAAVGASSRLRFVSAVDEIQLNAEGTSANVDTVVQAKGTGRFKYGTLVGTVDAPITGYIEIKDSSGTIRKLAVIS